MYSVCTVETIFPMPVAGFLYRLSNFSIALLCMCPPSLCWHDSICVRITTPGSRAPRIVFTTPRTVHCLLRCTFPSGSLVALVWGGLRNGGGSLKWSFAGGSTVGGGGTTLGEMTISPTRANRIPLSSRYPLMLPLYISVSMRAQCPNTPIFNENSKSVDLGMAVELVHGARVEMPLASWA